MSILLSALALGSRSMWRLLRRFISNHLVPVSSDGLDPARLLSRVPDGVGSEKLAARALIVGVF
jgi:hypothetical protein